MLVRITFSIFLAHRPKRSVESEISKSERVGEIFRIRRVRLVPPKLERRILVSGEFRKGMWAPFRPKGYIGLIMCVSKDYLIV